MPKFAYKGIDSEGEEAFGIIEADSEADALSEISRRGLFVEEVHPAHMSDEWRLRRQEARQEREARVARRQERKRQTRQRLVVRYADGHTENGMCFALNPRDTGFHLDLVDGQGISTGQTKQVRFSDLKAVFYVKSFDGKYDKSARFRDWTPEGSEMVVEFEDGEVIKGFSLHPYNENMARFFLIPEDAHSNNISILVEAGATLGVYTPEQYKEKRAKEREQRKKKDISEDLCQEETMGDFYFDARNYTAALEQYKAATTRFPKLQRLRRKLLACEYNVGVECIKRRDYAEALAYMDGILKVDPRNGHARKKVLQLRKIIEKQRQAEAKLASMDS